MRDKVIPLYYQIENILRGRILSGELLPGAPLPTEESLCREFNVSRVTVRRSLSKLENDGLIVRQRGRGTFVAEKPSPAATSRFSGSMEDLIALGIHTEAKVLAFELIEAPERVREKLDLENGERILRIEKIRSVENEPFSHVINYLPEKIGSRLSPSDMDRKPLLMILEDELGINAEGAIQTIEAVVAEPESVPLLDVRVGDPLLKVERIVFDADDNPVEYVSVLYRADKYCFNVRLRRERSDDSARWEPTKIK